MYIALNNDRLQENTIELPPFETVLDLYQASIFRLINGLVCNYHDAEDLTQEVFVKVYKKAHTFRGESDLGFWISKVARNHCYTFLRRKKLVHFISFEWLVSDNYVSFEDSSSANQLELKVERAETMESIYAALKQVPYAYREVFVLSEIHDMSYKDISDLLNSPIGTIKSRMSRGKDHLRVLLKEKEACHEKR